MAQTADELRAEVETLEAAELEALTRRRDLLKNRAHATVGDKQTPAQPQAEPEQAQLEDITVDGLSDPVKRARVIAAIQRGLKEAR
jgi:hypothetical protein